MASQHICGEMLSRRLLAEVPEEHARMRNGSGICHAKYLLHEQQAAVRLLMIVPVIRVRAELETGRADAGSRGNYC